MCSHHGAVALTTATSAALYAVGALVLASASEWSRVVRQVSTTASDAPKSTQGLWEGLRFVIRHRVVRELTLFTAGMNVVWAAVTALLVVYVVEPGPRPSAACWRPSGPSGCAAVFESFRSL